MKTPRHCSKLGLSQSRFCPRWPKQVTRQRRAAGGLWDVPTKGLETGSGPQQSEVLEASGPPALGSLAVGSPALSRFLDPGDKEAVLLLQEWRPRGEAAEAAAPGVLSWRVAIGL